MEINIRGYGFELLPEKAILWKAKKTLLITDVHLGKIMHFRKAGIAMPREAFEINFQKLDILVQTHLPERIIFLGDLFHHQVNEEWEHFENWRVNFASLEMISVLGNHDILPPKLFTKINITLLPELEENGFLFRHHPINEEKASHSFAFCGHVHPMFLLQSSAFNAMRLPCFVLESHQMILPSFGLFTGGYTIHRIAERRIFIIADSLIFEIP
jgi:DNA ligase-associated metallophosphoesterase